jgi:hypothetical protein
MATIKVGGRVKTAEGEGMVVTVHDANTLYPGKPLHKKQDTKPDRRDTHYLPGDKVYQVELDDQPMRPGPAGKMVRTRKAPTYSNFHESQVEPC